MSMTACRTALMRGRAQLRRWWRDRRGAALVQFMVVLPAMVFLVLSLVSLFGVMAVRDTLCEATHQAGRYLQVEGPHFDADDPSFQYPLGWERIAWQIIDQELASRTLTNLRLEAGKDVVDIWPDDPRRSPKDTIELQDDPQIVNQALFYVKATKVITIPYGGWLKLPSPDAPDTELPAGQMRLSCRTGAYYEGPPIEPTRQSRGPKPVDECDEPRNMCQPCPGCTNTPSPGDGTPTVCPICRPRR
jgi:hypothetical protein